MGCGTFWGWFSEFSRNVFTQLCCHSRKNFSLALRVTQDGSFHPPGALSPFFTVWGYYLMLIRSGMGVAFCFLLLSVAHEWWRGRWDCAVFTWRSLSGRVHRRVNKLAGNVPWAPPQQPNDQVTQVLGSTQTPRSELQPLARKSTIQSFLTTLWLVHWFLFKKSSSSAACQF